MIVWAKIIKFFEINYILSVFFEFSYEKRGKIYEIAQERNYDFVCVLGQLTRKRVSVARVKAV